VLSLGCALVGERPHPAVQLLRLHGVSEFGALLFQSYLFFSPGLAYNTKIIGPGWVQITASVLNQASLLLLISKSCC
jgi:hypothetical protein